MASPPAKAWRCRVCGYIHRQANPPDWCPVCGAAKAEFEPYVEPAPQPAAARIERWRCLNCNLVHTGAEPPGSCSVCGAHRDRFEPLEESAPAAVHGKATRAVVIGAGIAGASAVESLRQASPKADITLVSKETHLPYYRLNLTRYLAGEVAQRELPIHPEGWYGQNSVELLRGAEVSELSLDGQTVQLRDGSKLPFEKLILAAGAHPFIPPIPGTNREGVTSLRTLEDADRIIQACDAGMAMVCIGGGILGLETAGALARRGADVTLLESHGWLMPRQLNPRAGELLEEHVGKLGIKLRMKANTKEIAGNGRPAGVLLEDGATIGAGFVVIAAGVRPNSYLARGAGLEVGKGVVVDNHLATSHPNVLAAGDVAEHLGVLYGTWGASQYQGGIAGMNAAGLSAEFGGIPRSNTLKVLGVDLVSIGRFEPEDGSYQVIEQETDGRYWRFVFHDGRMVGSILLGDASISGPVKKAVEGKADFSGLLKLHPTAADVARHLSQTDG